MISDEELDIDTFKQLDDNQLDKLNFKMGQRVKILKENTIYIPNNFLNGER